MKFIIVTFLLATALSPKFCHAVEDDELAQWPEGSAAHTYIKSEREYKSYDKKLNEIYNKLIAAYFTNTSKAAGRKALQDAQRAWITYRDKNCKMIGELQGGVSNWKSAYTMACKADQTKSRFEELQSLLYNDTDDADL